MLVQGIHHVCIRCEKSEIEKVKEFYQGVLGMPAVSYTHLTLPTTPYV